MSDLEQVFATLQEPKRLLWVEAQDHFFKGALDELSRQSSAWDCHRNAAATISTVQSVPHRYTRASCSPINTFTSERTPKSGRYTPGSTEKHVQGIIRRSSCVSKLSMFAPAP